MPSFLTLKSPAIKGHCARNANQGSGVCPIISLQILGTVSFPCTLHPTNLGDKKSFKLTAPTLIGTDRQGVSWES